MRILHIVFLYFLFFVPLTGQTAVERFLGASFLKTANIGLLVQEIEGGRIKHEHNSEKMLVPASTLKLISTATALEFLGADFRFETKLQIDGEIDSRGVLNGNLYIYGGGDPTLGSEFLGDASFLKQWVEAVKKRGIKSITGAVIADDSLFDKEGVNPNWSWKDIGNYYAPGIYGISYKDNTVRVYFKSGSVGSTPIIQKTIPSLAELTFENNLKSSNITFDSAYFYSAPRTNHKIVSGAIPAKRESFIVKTDLPNPALLLAGDLHMALLENNIKIDKKPTDKIFTIKERTEIYTHFSPPLSEIIKEVNFASNNHYSEHLFRYLGAQRARPSTNKSSIEFVEAFWRNKGLSVEQLFMQDGCGLANSNAVSVNFFVQLLCYMNNKSENASVFYAALPRAGEEGTLARILKNTSLEGKMRAKSGGINKVRSYAGYIDKAGRKYAFALIVNNYEGQPRKVIKKMEEFFLEIE